ncbi:MAG: tRNA 4-thiouridine(8) synthase ThiI [Ruminococcus sp.]|nr:tRNA uracil 4-sulfurtransferase ThiI [uncultured Ruminococcus sp.]MBQ1349581.1 tRNA 4-thiouridine(8) synthase ThiI [Ruminococcus sp.]MBQ1617871.1 tRNA 4-thiouridine(8) synthase ThiI [Ruminococcus sp.]MBQ4260795.1 tRNA 4-thiouridine(8) synthase ThiI [Ruminococcus sp.]
MKEILLLKDGEIVLKGLNRRAFEDVLKRNIRTALRGTGEYEVTSAQSTIYVKPLGDDCDLDEASERIGRVFGLVSYSRAAMCEEKTMESVLATAPVYLAKQLKKAKTFKVEAKRSDKKFPCKSPEICREAGGEILRHFPHLRVDVHNPDVTVYVEIRDFGAYVHADPLRGAGGIPVGTGGKAVILISGGIDSPVAAYMMAKRGIKLTAVHFASPPYTSQRAEDKVVKLLRKVSRYAGSMRMITVPFTAIQEKLRDDCPEELFTIIMRRLMMQISERIAKQYDCAALITGESLGQVASQTIGALGCTDEAADMVVFRPLIGMDKQEIIDISYRIDTYETSIEPYEDCCTVFTPKHPRTKPILKFVKEAQERAHFEPLVEESLQNLKITYINPED